MKTKLLRKFRKNIRIIKDSKGKYYYQCQCTSHDKSIWITYLSHNFQRALELVHGELLREINRYKEKHGMFKTTKGATQIIP